MDIQNNINHNNMGLNGVNNSIWKSCLSAEKSRLSSQI